METKHFIDKNNKIFGIVIIEGWEKYIQPDWSEISIEDALLIAGDEITNDEYIVVADREKQHIITEANQKTQLWQTQLMLGIITNEDKASLTEWMRYVQKVQAVDTSAAPDIIWPEKPE